MIYTKNMIHPRNQINLPIEFELHYSMIKYILYTYMNKNTYMYNYIKTSTVIAILKIIEPEKKKTFVRELVNKSNHA